MTTYSKDELSDDTLAICDRLIDTAAEALFELDVEDSIKVLDTTVEKAAALFQLDKGRLVAGCKIRLRERARDIPDGLEVCDECEYQWPQGATPVHAESCSREPSIDSTLAQKSGRDLEVGDVVVVKFSHSGGDSPGTRTITEIIPGHDDTVFDLELDNGKGRAAVEARQNVEVVVD